MIVERKLPPQLKLRLSQWLPYLAAAAVLAGLSLLTYFLASAPAPVTSLSKVDAAQVTALQNTWGIDITNVGMIANGGLVDMRFQVVDPDKALGILDDDNYPVLIDEATGTPLFRPTSHGGHSGNFAAGRTYFFLYQNVNGLVKAGSRITIRFGDVTLEHVIIR
jgi:hypothetical protein